MAAAHLKWYRLYIVSHTIGTDKSTFCSFFLFHGSVLGLRFEHSSLTTSKGTHWLTHQRIFILRSILCYFFLVLLLLRMLMLLVSQTLFLSIVLSQYSFRFFFLLLPSMMCVCCIHVCICWVSCYKVLLCRRNECLIMTILMYVKVCMWYVPYKMITIMSPMMIHK